MYGPQLLNTGNFTPPKLDPVWAPKSFIFLALNILTVGIYGAAEKLAKEHRVTELKLEQQKLQDQVSKLYEKWDQLEGDLERLLTECQSLSSEKNFKSATLKSRLNQCVSANSALKEEEIKSNFRMATTIGEVALGTIAFVGQLLANILTIGLYGAYQYHTLSNRIKLEEERIQQYQEAVGRDQVSRHSRIETTINLAQAYLNEKSEVIDLQADLDKMSKTDPGKAYLAQQKAELDLDALQIKQAQLQRDIAGLRVQKVYAEQETKKVDMDLKSAQKEIQDLNQRTLHLQDEQWKANKEKQQLQDQIRAKEQEVARKKDEINDLLRAQGNLRAKAQLVQQLQREVDAHKNVMKHQSDAQKLQTQLGPVPPAYTPTDDDEGEIDGAMDVDLKAPDASLDPEWVEFARGYRARYGGDAYKCGVDLRSATELFQAGFRHSFAELIEMAKDGKIKFSDCLMTSAKPCRFALFRFMVLDMLKGAKLTENGCHGFKLQINEHVSMLPSQPEKVLQYKDDQLGGMKPVVIVHHKQRDDFTPAVEAIGQNGVDPVSAKWIVEQLDETEMGHLFNLLMDPVIENDHADLIKTKQFMENSHDPRVQLIRTGSDLIRDMAIAFEKRFQSNLAPLWEDLLDEDNYDEPFFKVEDEIDLTQIPDDVVVQDSRDRLVEWEFDVDVLGDKRPGDFAPRQSHFVDLLTYAKLRYKTVFDYLDAGILAKTYPKDQEYSKLQWTDLNPQYHVSHQMIGADQFFNGGQRCLFSNLLAVIMTDKSQLTDQNVVAMRNAMAAYLDKLFQAEEKWARIQNDDVLDEEGEQTKELALLAEGFRKAIARTHKGYSMESYQLWLRNSSAVFKNGAYHYPAQIDLSNLTEVEVQLCAYALGVRIGVLGINQNMPSKTDEHGLIVPDGQWYGPNTKEYLMIGCFLSASGGGTYYGLFPKLKLPKVDGFNVDYDELENLEWVDAYWKQVDMNKG